MDTLHTTWLQTCYDICLFSNWYPVPTLFSGAVIFQAQFWLLGYPPWSKPGVVTAVEGVLRTSGLLSLQGSTLLLSPSAVNKTQSSG